jgi:hypothetical protein
MGGDSPLAFFEYPKGVAKADPDMIGAMQHVSFACGPQRYREMLERLKTAGVTITAGPLLTIPPAIHSFYFVDPNGIRLEIVSDLDGDAEDLQVIRSCRMTETELCARARNDQWRQNMDRGDGWRRCRATGDVALTDQTARRYRRGGRQGDPRHAGSVHPI